MTADLFTGSGKGSANAQDDSQQLRKELTLFDKFKKIPKDIYEIATGENAEVEFPNALEATEIQDIDFFDNLLPSIETLFVRNDAGKAEIIASLFKDDERFGGAFSDKFDNPLILWNNVPHYINKPGASNQDLNTFLGTLIQYIPASKYVGKGIGPVSKAIRGMFGYGATETGAQITEAALAPETKKDKNKSFSEYAQDIGLMTGINVGVDLALPVAGKIARALTKPIASKIKSTFPKYEPKGGIEGENLTVLPEGKNFIATKGQAEAPPFDRTKSGDAQSQATTQLMKESEMRYAKTPGGEIIRGVDQQQLDDITLEAELITKTFGSGGTDGIPKDLITINSAEKIKNILTNRVLILKKDAKELYKKSGLDTLSITRVGVNDFATNALQVVKDFKIGPTLMKKFPDLSTAVNGLKRLKKLSDNPKFRPKSFEMMRDYQKNLNMTLRTLDKTSPEFGAMTQIKKTLDDFITRGIDRGFILGEAFIIKDLKKANANYKQYMGLSGRNPSQDPIESAANKILQKLVNPNLDADAVVTSFFGHSKFNPTSTMNLVLQKIKQGLPENEAAEIIALVKDGVLTKAFSGTGKSGVTRSNIVSNYSDVFKRNKKLISSLFSPQEIERIADFKQRVLPTLWAEIRLNPSNSGYTVIGAMARAGLLSYGKVIPLAGQTLTNPQTYQTIREVSKARGMVSNFMERKKLPLFSSESINNIMKPFRSSGALTPTVTGLAVEEQYQDDAAQSLPNYEQRSDYNADDIKPFIDSLSDEAKTKIMQVV
tara:strand:- start:43 stop:2361 length:2319 start_codon:yes stop_codon:yes gene_type:complete